MSNTGADVKSLSAPPARKVCEKFHVICRMAGVSGLPQAKKQPSFAKIRQAGNAPLLDVIRHRRLPNWIAPGG
jgi:hypothetical protein